ncbi:Os06g0222500 [Oryza sativa Japonica Group]|uniref:Os06g0222500 protein n=1 Tax=Oryza sativa subsp. japonica TaxID=39947 RepID=A0A0P0WUQ2_ORYSJ|nr:Os06g0222500 [Oryza sativa Japonica Group]
MVYKQLITVMRSKGMSPKNITALLTQYDIHHDTWGVVLLDMEQRVLKEEIVTLLPIERGIAMMRFVLGLLCTDMILHAGMYRDTLEKEATHEDLLIPNTGNFVETPYDVDCMERMPTNTSVLATSPKI